MRKPRFSQLLISMAQWKLICALLLLIGSAYVSVTLPISEKGIPFSAQSLVVFYLAGVLKPRLTGLLVLTYLGLGVLGLPVFAEGTSGFAKIIGPSGGFLYGFLISGFLISFLVDSQQVKALKSYIFIMILGTIVLFICGLGQLTYQFGFEKALEYGFYPIWKMALVKAFLASFLVFWTKPRLFG